MSAPKLQTHKTEIKPIIRICALVVITVGYCVISCFILEVNHKCAKTKYLDVELIYKFCLTPVTNSCPNISQMVQI